MKKHSTKQLLVLFSVLVAILVGLHFVAFLFIRNAGVTVSTLERDINSLQAQVTEFSKYSAEDMKRLAQTVTEKIISRDGFVQFLENIETTARAHSMSILVRSVDEQPNSDDPNDTKELVRLNLETRGSWQNTLRFVKYLESLPYKTELKRVSLTALVETAPAADEAGGEVKVVVPLTSTSVWRAQIELTALKFK